MTPSLPKQHGKNPPNPGLAARRQQLVRDVKRQRQVFGMQLAALQPPLIALEQRIAKVKSLKQHPAPLIGIGGAIALVVVLIKPRRLAAAARGVRRAARLMSMAAPLPERFARARPHTRPHTSAHTRPPAQHALPTLPAPGS